MELAQEGRAMMRMNDHPRFSVRYAGLPGTEDVQLGRSTRPALLVDWEDVVPPQLNERAIRTLNRQLIDMPADEKSLQAAREIVMALLLNALSCGELFRNWDGRFAWCGL